MELATVINYATYAIIGVFFFLGLLIAVVYWKYGRDCSPNKMIAEIERSSGFSTRDLVKIEDDGRTVKVDGGTYILGKEADEGRYPLSEEERAKERTGNEIIGDRSGRPYPIRRWTYYPDVPFLGLKFLRRRVRVETWVEGNPEPKRSFYGTINADGFFEGVLYATASEITSLKNVGEAAGLVGQIEEARARQKTLEKTLANIPNKNILYIGLGVVVIGIIVCGILLFVVYGGIDTILAGWGFK